MESSKPKKPARNNEAILMHRIIKTLEIESRSAEALAARCGLSRKLTLRTLNLMTAAGITAIVGYIGKTPIWGIDTGAPATPRRKTAEKIPEATEPSCPPAVVRLGAFGV